MSVSLTYFDFDGSRGLECRLALTLAGIVFDDVRLGRAEWAALKPNTPFGSLPVLTVDGAELAQCCAILTYIGRGHGLHPTDPWAAAQHEAVMQSVEDLRAKMPGSPGMSDDAKKAAREAFAAGHLAQWAATMERTIVGPFLAGDTIHVADLKLFVILSAYLSGAYDHIPATVFAPWPKLLALHGAVAAHPVVAGYLAARRA